MYNFDKELDKLLQDAIRFCLFCGFRSVEASIFLKFYYKTKNNMLDLFLNEKALSFSHQDVDDFISEIIESESYIQEFYMPERRKKYKEKADNGEVIKIIASKEISRIMDELDMLECDVITTDIFFAILVEQKPKALIELSKKIGFSYNELEEFAKKSIGMSYNIPIDLDGIIRIKNDDVKEGEPKRILGRDEEMQNIWQILSKKTKSNVILVGEPGVGKTAIAELMVYDIVNHKCPKQFEDYIVVQLDTNSLIAGTIYRGMAEERFEQIKQMLEDNKNIILFIDEIHTILGAGACSSNKMDFANSLKPLLAGDKVKVVGATTNEEYLYFSQDRALARRFEKVLIKEPKHSEVYQMVKGRVQELMDFHGVRISKAKVKHIILQASCYYNDIANPDRTIDFLDKAMAVTKMRNAKMVMQKDINKVLKTNLSVFSKMPIEDKKATAYHEAGHCVVLLKSKLSKVYNIVAVSIMPADNYLGVTVSEEKEEAFAVTWDKELYIELLAMRLAGRVAEKSFTNKNSSGASQDLKKANNLAKKIATEMALDEKNPVRTYESDDRMSERINNEINFEIKTLLDCAYRRAEEIVNANTDLIEKLVNELIIKGIVNHDEIVKMQN